MQRKQISDETLLAVVEMSIRRTAENIKKDGRGGFVTTTEAIGAVTEAIWGITEANQKGNAQEIAEAFLNVASVCMFAVGSMVVSDNSTAPVEGVKDAPVDPEIAKQLAHQKMMERTTASGLIIASEMPSF